MFSSLVFLQDWVVGKCANKYYSYNSYNNDDYYYCYYWESKYVKNLDNTSCLGEILSYLKTQKTAFILHLIYIYNFCQQIHTRTHAHMRKHKLHVNQLIILSTNTRPPSSTTGHRLSKANILLPGSNTSCWYTANATWRLKKKKAGALACLNMPALLLTFVSSRTLHIKQWAAAGSIPAWKAYFICTPGSSHLARSIISTAKHAVTDVYFADNLLRVVVKVFFMQD